MSIPLRIVLDVMTETLFGYARRLERFASNPDRTSPNTEKQKGKESGRRKFAAEAKSQAKVCLRLMHSEASRNIDVPIALAARLMAHATKWGDGVPALRAALETSPVSPELRKVIEQLVKAGILPANKP